MKSKSIILPLLLIYLALLAGGCGSIPETKTPKIDQFICKDRTGLGLWDDIFCSRDFPLFVMRRGSDIFLLNPEQSGQPVFIARFNGINDAKFVFGRCIEKNIWLFCNSKVRGPLVINLTDKKVTALDEPIPIIDFFLDIPFVQSWVYSEPNKSVYLKICGGHNIWLSLEKGNWKSLPSDWFLKYFSLNMKIAVFQKNKSFFSSERILTGMEMKTGKETADFPVRNLQPRVPYSWEDENRAKFIVDSIKNKGDRIVGASCDGRVFLQDFQVKDSYPRKVEVKDNWLLYLFSGEKNYSLWFAPAQNGVRPNLISNKVREAFMLDNGKCVYSVSSMEDYDSNKNIMDVFVYDAKKNKKWNVLQGKLELPFLKPNIRKHPYIRDSRKVSMINGFGKEKKQLALIMFHHCQSDQRSFPVPPVSGKPPLLRMTWRKDLIVSADGILFSGKLFSREINKILIRQSIWLHNSGKVFFATEHFVNGELKQALQMKQIILYKIN